MHRCQGTAAGPLLRLFRAAAVGPLGARENAAERKDEDVAVGELLFELAGQALLDSVKAGEEGDRNEDNDCLFAVADFNLRRGKEECQ